MGESSTPDESWPEDDCCRIYSKHQFTGRHMDVCLDDGKAKRYELLDTYEGYNNWANEISSWKCGPDAMPALGHKDKPDEPAETGADNSYNKALSEGDNLFTSIKIIPANKSIVRGTIYSEQGCQGQSLYIAGDIVTTGMTYSYEDTYTEVSYVRSILLRASHAFEVFAENDFRTDSHTLKNFESDQVCLDVEEVTANYEYHVGSFRLRSNDPLMTE